MPNQIMIYTGKLSIIKGDLFAYIIASIENFEILDYFFPIFSYFSLMDI
jgi:hypothetical protein